jgi:hypothetical protein
MSKGRQLDSVWITDYPAEIIITLYEHGVEVEVEPDFPPRQRFEEWLPFTTYPELEALQDGGALVWHECDNLVDGIVDACYGSSAPVPPEALKARFGL